MENEHERHLDGIISRFTTLASRKYRAGVEEHGGKLWQKTGLIDMAIDEAIDQVVYLITLKQQLEEAGMEPGTVTE